MRILRVIDGASMALGHVGLEALCKNNFKFSLLGLPKDNVVVFINKARNKAKIMGGGGFVLGYLSLPSKEKIDLNTLQYIPRTFGSQGFDYPKALKLSLEKRLGASPPITASSIYKH